MQKLNLSLLTIVVLCSCAQKSELSDWRGPERNGIYQESGLLKQWPDEGPTMLWSFEGIGNGHNSVAVANDKIYVTGVKDSIKSMGILHVLDRDGELLWKKVYGNDFTSNFIGTRSTPVVFGDHIYIESGSGLVYCINAENGEEIWSIDFIKDLGVDSLIQFGYSESVLINGDQLICVPGGKENNVVALNRFTGEKIWSCKGIGESATYNSPILAKIGSKHLVIAMTASSIMGIDATSGEMYWRIEHTQRNNIHANTPIYEDGKLVLASPDPVNTSGLVQIRIWDNGEKAELVWRNKNLRSFMGGFIKIDSCLYGSAYKRKDWQVINWNTGEMMAQNKELGGGSIIFADGMFYCYSELSGEMALVEANAEKFEVISKFSVPLGTSEHWAHPVIYKGVLYIRHGDALMAYSIIAKK